VSNWQVRSRLWGMSSALEQGRGWSISSVNNTDMVFFRGS
jgi:hypothetical protein